MCRQLSLISVISSVFHVGDLTSLCQAQGSTCLLSVSHGNLTSAPVLAGSSLCFKTGIEGKTESHFTAVGMIVVHYHLLYLSGLSSGSDPLGAWMRSTCCACRCQKGLFGLKWISPWAKLHDLCILWQSIPQLISLFLTLWLQWVDVWQQAVFYTPLNFSPDPES